MSDTVNAHRQARSAGITREIAQLREEIDAINLAICDIEGYLEDLGNEIDRYREPSSRSMFLGGNAKNYSLGIKRMVTMDAQAHITSINTTITRLNGEVSNRRSRITVLELEKGGLDALLFD